MKKNVIVGQSGGPTAVINASLYGVVCEALKHSDLIENVYGMINGIEGFLNGQVMDMKPLEDSGELELIRTTPGILSRLLQVQAARRIWMMRSTPSCSADFPTTASDISSISAEMIPWIL